VRRQFIRPDRAELPGDDAFRFDHILIRDAAYESIPKEARAELHKHFAFWLEDRLGAGALDEIVGYHLEQACQYLAQLELPAGNLVERAAEKLARAARAAAARGDVHAQVSFLERAAALLPDAAESRPSVLANLGAALVKSGEDARAIQCLRDAELLAHAMDDAHSEWLARLERRPLETLRDPLGMAEALLTEADAAITKLPDDHEVVARAWHMKATAHSFRGQLLESFRANQTALEHARLIEDATFETEIVMNSGGPIALGPIPVEEGFRWISDALDGARNRAVLEGWGQHMLAHLRARLGELDVAVNVIDEWRAHLRELGHESEYVATAGCAWDVRWLAQDWAGGERVLRDADEALERAGEKGYRSTVAANLASSTFRARATRRGRSLQPLERRARSERRRCHAGGMAQGEGEGPGLPGAKGARDLAGPGGGCHLCRNRLPRRARARRCLTSHGSSVIPVS